jgi:hypothetical protein
MPISARTFWAVQEASNARTSAVSVNAMRVRGDRHALGGTCSVDRGIMVFERSSHLARASQPQPALGAARGRRFTNRELGRQLGYSEDWIGRILLGHVPAPARFRAGLAELLGAEEAELFDS